MNMRNACANNKYLEPFNFTEFSKSS